MNFLLELNTWTAFKATCITTKGLNCQFSEASDRYEIYGPDGNGIMWRVSIQKTNPIGADQEDFETNYKALFNGKMTQLDSDGALMSRTKVAPSGWNYQLRGMEFTTGTAGSLVNKDVLNADISDATLTLYDAQGQITTDLASCVKTVLDFEPAYDIYVVGGKMRFLEQPTADVRLNLIGVPDVPASLGGSKPFIQNVNLKFIPTAEGVQADGRAAKWLQYSATYHTNKLRVILYHPVSTAVPIELLVELYKQ